MDPGTLALLIPILALLIPVVAILSKAFVDLQKLRADTAAQLGRATGHLDGELAEAKAERDRLRRRIEALEAIVTTDDFDLEREARRAGITDAAGRIDPALLDPDPARLGTEAGDPARGADRAARRRTR